MECGLVIDRDLFAGFNVAQGDEQDMAVENLHVGVGLAGMIDVVGAVAIAAAVETPAIVDGADAQLGSAGPAIRFGISDLLAGVLRDLSPAFERSDCKAAPADDRRFPDCQAWGEFEFHVEINRRILHCRPARSTGCRDRGRLARQAPSGAPSCARLHRLERSFALRAHCGRDARGPSKRLAANALTWRP